MADPLQRLIELSGLPLQGELRAEWSATTRLEIRRAIGAGLDIKAPLDLQTPPRHADWSISISHTSDMGGWVAARLPLHVGFDIEQANRITPKLIARIASQAEIARAPEARFLWGAKEAAFKSGFSQVATIAEIEILKWQTCGDAVDAWTFFGQRGQGWIFAAGERIYALYVVSK